jgi:hypothetical protein
MRLDSGLATSVTPLLIFFAVELRAAHSAHEQVQLFAFRRNHNQGAFDFQYWHTPIIPRILKRSKNG